MGYGGGGNAAELARQQDDERQAKIAQGRQSIDANLSGFNDEFYQQRANDYEGYALPQFNKQARNTRNQLAAALARRGLLKSGAAQQQDADLTNYASQKRAEIGDAALGESNKLRSQVEDQRTQLTNQLITSGDPATASAGALTAASTLKRPNGFGALGNFFSDWVDNYKANQVAQSYDPSVQPMFSFGGKNNGNSVSYVG